MEIVKLKPEELEMVKSLADNKEYFDTDNIMWDRSIKCVANNGDLLGYVLIKPHSLFDFFGGEIPADTNASPEKRFRIRRKLIYFENSQYEVLFYMRDIKDTYIESDNIDDIDLQYHLSHEIELDDNGNNIGWVLWSNSKLPIFMCDYKSFNDIVYINFPLDD